ESDHLHVAPVHSDDESLSSREDLQQPLTIGRELHGRRRRRAGASGQHADEMDNAWWRGQSLKRILRNKTRNVAALANNDLGDKRQFARHFGSCLRLGHWSPKD